MELHPQLVPTVRHLMQVAETAFGPKSGKAKREWVIATLTTLAQAVDIPLLPAAIEEPIKAAIIRVVIETVWTLLYRSVTPAGATPIAA